LGTAVANYLADPGDPGHVSADLRFPTFAGLVDIINTQLNSALQGAFAATPVTVRGGLFSDSLELRFDVHLDLSKAIQQDLDLGAGFATLGVNLPANTKIDISVGLDLDFSLGLDLTDLANGDALAADDFFVLFHEGEVSVLAELELTIPSLSTDLGPVQGTLALNGGYLRLDGTVNIGLVDPDGDGKLRFSELANPLSLLQLEARATLEASLPLSGSLSGPGFTIAGAFTVTLRTAAARSTWISPASFILAATSRNSRSPAERWTWIPMATERRTSSVRRSTRWPFRLPTLSSMWMASPR
jgi:hypothetical protein